MKSLFGRNIKNDEDYSANFNANPTRSALMKLNIMTAVGVYASDFRISTTLTYYCYIFDRALPAQS